jgi:hypothetical protein
MNATEGTIGRMRRVKAEKIKIGAYKNNNNNTADKKINKGRLLKQFPASHNSRGEGTSILIVS